MRIGTSYFVSKAAAMRYYKRYNDKGYGYWRLANDVANKIINGEIHIGKPQTKKGEHLVLIDDDTRYAIETCQQ